MAVSFAIEIGEYDNDTSEPMVSVTIGNYSGVFDDAPEPIRELAEIINKYEKITPELIEEVEAIEWRNSTEYTLYVTKDELLKILRKYIGERIDYSME